MSTSDDDTKGNVVPFPAAQGVQAGLREDQLVVPYYPDKLKRYYLDLLLRYKNQRAKELGRGYGWQSIRDEIMSAEDEELVEVMRKRKINVDVDRPRSPYLTVDDLKGWYRAGNSHLPSDLKFQYIDRLIRGLRLEGRIEAIERALSEARREYFRESVTQFYRPDLAFPKQIDAEAKDPRVEVHEFMNRAVFVGVCQKGYEGLQKMPDHGAPTRFVVILLCGEFKRCAVPVDLLACFLDDMAWSEAQSASSGPYRSIATNLISRCNTNEAHVISLYSGFFVPEVLTGIAVAEMVAGLLLTAKPSDTAPYNQGFPHGIPRYYSTTIRFHNSRGGAMLVEETPGDPLIFLGLAPIKEDNQSGLVKCGSNPFLEELRGKFEIGYRPC